MSESPSASHALPARLAFDVANEQLTVCSQALAGGTRCFDLSACADFDSSLIGLLLELRRQAGALGCSLQLQAPPPRLLQLAGLYGVETLLFGAGKTASAVL